MGHAFNSSRGSGAHGHRSGRRPHGGIGNANPGGAAADPKQHTESEPSSAAWPPLSTTPAGGGAGHQSASAGPSRGLGDVARFVTGDAGKAHQRPQRRPAATQRRIRPVQAGGVKTVEAVNGRRFGAVLCPGLLGYLAQPHRW